jgi:hypothetical protein
MEQNKITEIKFKILKGLEISFQKLVQSKKKDDKELIYSYKGKIIKIKARDIKM